MLNTFFFVKDNTQLFWKKNFHKKTPNHNRVTVIRIMWNIQVFKVLAVETNQMQSRYNLISQTVLVVTKHSINNVKFLKFLVRNTNKTQV